MENNKNEFSYVMSILKCAPIPNQNSNFSTKYNQNQNNNYLKFSPKPEFKYDTFSHKPINSKIKNDNSFTENSLASSINSLKIFNIKKETKPFQTNQKFKPTSQRNQILKPEIVFHKFPSREKNFTSSNYDNKWFKNNLYTNSNINYNNLNSLYREKSQNKKQQSRSFSQTAYRNFKKNKIRYLNFRPFIDLPKIKKEISKSNSKNNILGISSLSNKNIFSFNKSYYFKLLGNECLLVKKLLEDNGFIQSKSNEDWTILWSSGHIKLNLYKNLTPWQKMNHFPRSNELTRKDLLYKNLSKLKAQFPGSKFDFIPESYILPNEYSFLKDQMERKPNQFWIIKPVAMSQGRGIFLTKNINEIPNNFSMIASRYINNPFLINKKKFDLRIYVFVTSIVPLRIYRYNEGLTRFSSNNYSNDVNDRCAHLTNYAVNKNNKNYVQNCEPFDIDYNSSKWTLASFRQYLEEHGIDSEVVFDKIDDIIVKTLISCENSLINAIAKHTEFQENCFELYGFDILLDDKLNTWIMEVNLSPNLHFDAAIDLKIKGEMIAEIFDLIRIVPYDLRNDNFGVSDFNSISKYLSLDEFKDIKINTDLKRQIWESEEEANRTKQFKRIFPTINYNAYKKFFDQERLINYILYVIEKNKRDTICENIKYED